eukprot:s2284_g10.t1
MAALWRWPPWLAGIVFFVRFFVPLEAADVAKLAAEAAEAAVSAKVRGSKRRRSGDLAPYDISNELCWADQSKETCCQGDATTHAECWDESYSFEECCPNADCWDGKLFNYEACCDQKHGEKGNPGCWSGYYDYEHCCLANRSSQSWVDIILREIDTDQFYGMDEFYTDSQYGNDFGYYSTGRVLGKSDGKTAQEFAHYTTYPMALSPHFGRVLCRLVFIMWIQMKEKAPFRVVEMGAGSGQLAHDIHVCVKRNELGIEPAVWRRFVGAFEYVIVERSPALARRQRQRGLKVVNGDAQRKDSCPSVLRALASSDACSAGSIAPECQVSDRADKHTAASVVLSNELLDAFAPVKLQLSIYGQPVVTHCRAWQEIRMVHIIKLKDLESISQALQHSEERISAMAMDLEGYTNEGVGRLRVLEGDLRDELAKGGFPEFGCVEGAAAPPAAPSSGKGSDNSQALGPPQGSEPDPQFLTAKAHPPARPEHLDKTPAPSKPLPVKVEPSEDERKGKDPGVEEITKASSSHRHRSRREESHRSRSRRRRGEERSPRSRSRHRRERRSREGRDRRRREEDSPEIRSEGGKEKKARPDRPAEPLHPPRHQGPIPAWGPREPAYPPPSAPSTGWRGALPVSDHPRWSQGVNKGQVKRAKQELFGRRRGR